jgi:hypothetical protein
VGIIPAPRASQKWANLEEKLDSFQIQRHPRVEKKAVLRLLLLRLYPLNINPNMSSEDLRAAIRQFPVWNVGRIGYDLQPQVLLVTQKSLSHPLASHYHFTPSLD